MPVTLFGYGSRMRAIVYTQTGPSSVLTLVDRPVPVPREGEVVVRIEVSGVNPTDWKSRSGMVGPLDPGVEQVPKRSARASPA